MKTAEINLRKLIRSIILESKEFQGLALGAKGKVEITQKEFDDKIRKCARLLEDWSYLPAEHGDKNSWEYKAWLEETADEDARIRDEFTRLVEYLYNSTILEETFDGEEQVYYDDINDLLAYIESFVPESSRFAHAVFNFHDSAVLDELDNDVNPQLAAAISKLSNEELIGSDFFKAAERAYEDNKEKIKSIHNREYTGAKNKKDGSRSKKLDWVETLRKMLSSRVAPGSISKDQKGRAGMSIEGPKVKK